MKALGIRYDRCYLLKNKEAESEYLTWPMLNSISKQDLYLSLFPKAFPLGHVCIIKFV